MIRLRIFDEKGDVVFTGKGKVFRFVIREFEKGDL